MSRPTAPKRSFEPELEGLRGVAAILVAFLHIEIFPVLDPTWQLPEFWRWFHGGISPVMLFFMLSGYVISLNHNEPYAPGSGRNYVARRAMRILPVYFVAWLFSVILSHGIDVKTIAANLVLLQNFDGYFGLRLEPLYTNGPLWSLNYEAVYYLGFIGLWYYRPRLRYVFAASLALGLLGWWVNGFPRFLAGYGSGWIFWGAGCWLARQPKIDSGPNTWPVVSGLLLMSATALFNSGFLILNHLGLNHLGLEPLTLGMVNLPTLSLLPATLLVMAGTTRRRLPLVRLISFFAFAQCIGTTALLFMTGRTGELAQWVAAAGFTILACALAPFRGTSWLVLFAPLGGISYAIYIIHFPMMFLVQRLPLPHGSFAGFAIRVLAWLVLTLGASWLLDCRFQPWIKRRLMPRPVPAPI